MTSKIPLLAGAAFVCLLRPALAQQMYVGIESGVNFAGTLSASSDATDISTNAGPAVIADLGWRFDNGIRAEVEGSYRSNGIDTISTRRQNGLMEPLGGSQGNLATYGAMVNVAYDIPLHLSAFPIKPYVGAGIGYSWLNFGNAGGQGFATVRNGSVTNTGPVLVGFGSAGAFAYQAIAGISAPIEAVPGLEVLVEYRFLGSAQADVPVTRTSLDGNTVNGVAASARTHNAFTLADNAILVGLRYSFSAGF